MSSHYVLDTDTVVDVLRHRDRIVERLAAVSPDDIGVTTMTLAELLYGALSSRDVDRNINDVRRFAANVRVLPFGRNSAAVHAELRFQLRNQPIGPNDLVIAATALASGAALVTSNTRAFGRIRGLSVEDWRS